MTGHPRVVKPVSQGEFPTVTLTRAFCSHDHIMQALRGLRGVCRALELRATCLSPRAQLSGVSGWHAASGACQGASSAHLTYVQSQLRTVTQQPIQSGNQRVVILGTGWAAGRLVKDLDCNHYDVTVRHVCLLHLVLYIGMTQLSSSAPQVVSPRNHMVYTPLLTSACVGTLDFRSVAVPIMALQKHLKEAQNNFFLATAQEINSQTKQVHCKDEDGTEFDIPYDKLVIATGSQVGKQKSSAESLTLGPQSAYFVQMYSGTAPLPTAGQHIWYPRGRSALTPSKGYQRCQWHQEPPACKLEQSQHTWQVRTELLHVACNAHLD